MKNYIVIASEPIKPLDPKTYQNTDWGLVVFSVLLAPLVLAGARDFLLIVQRKITHQEKIDDSKRDSVQKIVDKAIEEKSAFVAATQEQNAKLLNEVLTAREEDIKSLQSTQAAMAEMLATTATSLKTYFEMANERYKGDRTLLEQIRTLSERTVLESINSHIKMSQMGLHNQKKILEELKELRKISSAMIELLEVIQKTLI